MLKESQVVFSKDNMFVVVDGTVYFLDNENTYKKDDKMIFTYQEVQFVQPKGNIVKLPKLEMAEFK